MNRRPRVHHLEDGQPVFDGAECFARCGGNPDRLSALLLFLPGTVHWPGFFGAAKAQGYSGQQAGALVRDFYQAAYGRELWGTPEADAFDLVLRSVYGEGG